MRRSIFNAGVWTALGLAVAFAIVSANSNTRRAVTTAAPAAKATVASASSEKCSANDVCCARDEKAAVAAVTPRAAKPKTAARPTGVNGMVIAIDPETGELTAPTAEQMAGLQAQVLPGDDLNNSDIGLTPVHHADGSVSVNLQGRFMETATVQITPNGQKVFGCTTNPKQALNPANTPASSGLEEK